MIAISAAVGLSITVAAVIVAGVAIYLGEHSCIACGRRFPTVDERLHHERRAHQLN